MSIITLVLFHEIFVAIWMFSFQISWIRTLVLSLLRLCDAPNFFAGLLPDFPLPKSNDSDFQLGILSAVAKVSLLCSKLIFLHASFIGYSLNEPLVTFQYNLWEVFEVEWRELIAGQHFARSNRRSIQGKPHDTATLWRVLNFYSLVFSIIPPDDVVSIMMQEKLPVALRQHDTHQARCNQLPHAGAAMLRHSRFNPTLLKKRIAEAEGVYVQAQKTDKM